MRRTLALTAAFLALAAVAHAQRSERVPLGNRVYDVFELTPAAPSHVFNIDVPGAAELVVDVRTAAVAVDVEVRNPSGTLLPTSGYTRLTLGPNDVPPLGALLFEEGLHVQVAVPNPAGGRWTVRVTLPSGSPNTFVSATAFMAGGLGISALTSRPTYFAGDTAVIAALVFDGVTPVASATVLANVYQEGGEASPVILTLLDDGVEPDATAGDGLFTAQLAALSPGHYLAEAVVQAGTRRASAGTDFLVTPRLARFTGTFSDAGVDTNGDGLFEHVALHLETEVETAGTYAVTAVLRKDATHSLIAGTQLALDTGTTTVTVPFAAAAIRRFLAADGPYQIAEAVLTRLGDDTAGRHVADHRLDLGLTTAYTLAQMQRPITIVLPGITEAGVDTDADGQFDFLQVQFDVDTRQFGSYTWTGDLRAGDGTILGVASGQGFLQDGVNTVEFLFPGLPIGESGKDGPYVVGNVAVYGPPNAAAVVDEVGRTRPYSFSQFEGAVVTVTFDQLISAVQTVPITSGHPSAAVLRKVLLLEVKLAKFAAEHGQPNASAVLLRVFIHHVQALATGNRITAADAARLVDLATRLIDQL